MILASDVVAFRGSGTGGADFFCGRCREFMLIENVPDGQIIDVKIRCPRCGAINSTRQAPTTGHLPLGVVLEGVHTLRTPVEALQGVVVASRRAYERFTPPSGDETRFMVGPGSFVDPRTMIGSLDTLRPRARALLGTKLDLITATYERGRKSTTPPKRFHRLAELLDRGIEKWPVSVVRMNELVRRASAGAFMIGLLERWKDHPLWNDLQFESPDQFDHTIVSLGALSLMRDLGNAVILNPSGGKRACDLGGFVGPKDVVGFEVKAPEILQQYPREALGPEQCIRVIRKSLAKAGTGVSGQLAAGRDSVLIVGGFDISEEELDELKLAGEKEFHHYAAERKHIAGVIFSSVRLPRTPYGSTRFLGLPNHEAGIILEIALNPNNTNHRLNINPMTSEQLESRRRPIVVRPAGTLASGGG